MLGGEAERVGRNQQDPSDPGHRGIQRVDVLVVADPDRDAAVGAGRARARVTAMRAAGIRRSRAATTRLPSWPDAPVTR